MSLNNHETFTTSDGFLSQALSFFWCDNFLCQHDWVWNHLGVTPLGISREV